MRVLSYKNEKIVTCEHCGTKLAYAKDDIKGNEYGDSVESVESFLRWVMSNKNIFSQLKESQIAVLKSHLDWACYSVSRDTFVTCPHCNKQVDLAPIFTYIEIYPDGSTVVDGEVSGKSIRWHDFNEIK